MSAAGIAQKEASAVNDIQAVNYAFERRSIWGHLMRTAFRQGWVDVAGVSTRYVQAGPSDAPVVVMLHGTGSSWECFSANLEAHAKHFNCYAIDMVGSGLTDKPDYDYEIPVYVEHVRNFMLAMGIAKASLIGVSLGAWVSCRFALTHPAMVDKLTLLASSGRIVNRETMGRTRGIRTRAVDDPSWENIKPVFNSILYREEDRIDDIISVRQSIYRDPAMKRAMEHILCLQIDEVRTRNLITDDEWRRIAAPTLVILAPDDNPDYFETGKAIAELMPDARTFVINEVKHWAQFEKPDVFNRVNLEFLTGA
jgi:2-hydroxy-6-oxonona-2,4-dienedioate hydrolase